MLLRDQSFALYLDYGEAKLYQRLKEMGYRLDQSDLRGSLESKKQRLVQQDSAHVAIVDNLIAQFLAYGLSLGLALPSQQKQATASLVTTEPNDDRFSNLDSKCWFSLTFQGGVAKVALVEGKLHLIRGSSARVGPPRKTDKPSYTAAWTTAVAAGHLDLAPDGATRIVQETLEFDSPSALVSLVLAAETGGPTKLIPEETGKSWKRLLDEGLLTPKGTWPTIATTNEAKLFTARPAPSAPPLTVVLDNGTVLSGETDTDVFIAAIESAGIQKVENKNFKLAGVPLISDTKQGKYKYGERLVGKKYIAVHSDTKTKATLLNKISIALALGWQVSVGALRK